MQRALHVRILCAVFTAWLCSVTPTAAQEPATRPAASDVRQRVLVLPFESLSGDANDDAALTHAIGRSLVVDLAHGRNFHAIEGGKVATDPAAALEAGKAEGARRVVWGTVQRVEGRIRITGQVLDVERGESAGQFKLTGSFRELFELQDLLAEQVQRRLQARGKADEQDKANVDEPQRPSSAPADAGDAPEVPAGESLRVRPHPLDPDPDWLAAPDPFRGGNDLRYRYNYGYDPYWSVPYTYGVWPFGYGYGYGGYHHSFYRPYRPLHQHRYDDYTFRGIPDRRPYRGFGPRHIRSFTGPVPLRWYVAD